MNEPTTLEDIDVAQQPPVLDWVPASETGHAARLDYPIEGGVPHPRWIREPAEHRLAAHPVVVRESAAVVRLLFGLAIAAFLLGMTIFYPVSPLR
jgi:hypothetical protein